MAMAPNPLCVYENALWLKIEQILFDVRAGYAYNREGLASRAEHFPKYGRKEEQSPKGRA
jgi:hypothetical protein